MIAEDIARVFAESRTFDEFRLKTFLRTGLEIGTIRFPRGMIVDVLYGIYWTMMCNKKVYRDPEMLCCAYGILDQFIKSRSFSYISKYCLRIVSISVLNKVYYDVSWINKIPLHKDVKDIVTEISNSII